MAKLNWFLTLKNMSKSDTTAKELLDEINNADSEESKAKAKETAKEYVESMAEPEPETTTEPEHIETVSEIEVAEKELSEPVQEELTVEIDTETTEETGARPEPHAPVNQALINRIRRRKEIAEANARKRMNQPITLSEQKEAARQRARELMERNARMIEQRKAMRERIQQQMAERAAHNEKNMVGLYTILLREIKLRKRLELICHDHKFTRADLEKLKEVNPSGWQECVKERPWLDKELEMYIG